MAVLCNANILAGASLATEAAETTYGIEKSLRLNQVDDTYLRRTNIKSGNPRAWTLSYWVKRNILSTWQWNFCQHQSGQVELIMGFRDDNTFGAQQNTNSVGRKTTRKFTDTNAWYHFVIRCDTNDDSSDERLQIFCNGERVDDTNGSGTVAQNHVFPFNQAQKQDIGTYASGNTYSNINISNVEFIDNLTLSPAAFGKFDASGLWVPKTFAIPTANNGTTWSSDCTFTNTTRDEENLFDGRLSNSSAGVIQSNSSNTAKVVFNTEVKGSIIDVWNDSGSNVLGFNTETPNQSVSNAGWKTIYSGPETTLEKITWKQGSGQGRIDGIRVDGQVLLDGTTAPTARSNPNNGTKWSDLVTGTAYTNQGGDKAFDGSSGTLSQASNPGNASLTFKPKTAITGNIEILIAAGLHGGAVTGEFDLKIGNVSKFDNDIWPNNVTAWVNLGQQTIDTTYGLVWGNASGGNWHGIKMIKVDGHVLVDEAIDTSYRLSFDDLSNTRSMGYDSMIPDLSSGNKGLAYPILKTDKIGSALTSGTRDDDDSSNLKLAIAGTAFTDLSGNSVNVSASGAVISSDQSHFYGSSIFFDGTDDHITTAGSLWSANGNQTFECWIWANNITSSNGHTLFDTGGSGQLLIQQNSGVKRITIHPSDSNYARSEDTIPEDAWVHIAFTQTSNTRTVFINGKQVTAYAATAGNAQTAAWNTPTGTFRIGHESANSRDYFDGYMQDIRVYDKVKYTNDFTPPRRADFSLNKIQWTIPTVKNHSNYLTSSTGAFNSSDPATKGFDGDTSTQARINSVGAQLIWEPPSGIHVETSLEFYQVSDWSGTNHAYINGKDCGNMSDGSTGWKNLNFTGTLWKFEIGKNSSDGNGNAHPCLNALRLNGSTVISDTTGLTGSSWHGDDSLNDSPTNVVPSGGDTGKGAEVSGNYCTLNPIDFVNTDSSTLTQGNFTATGPSSSSNFAYVAGTLAIDSADTKGYYFEVEWQTLQSAYNGLGFLDVSEGLHQRTSVQYHIGHSSHNSALGVTIGDSHLFNYGTALGRTGANWSTSGDVAQVAIKAGKIWWGKNNTWFNNGSGTGNPSSGANPMVTLSASKTLTPVASLLGNSGRPIGHFNFGQRPFRYTAPTGFRAICTANTDDTLVSGNDKNNPSKHFDVTEWEGDGSSPRTISMTHGDFTPGMVWLKPTTEGGRSHYLYDVIRTFAANKELVPNSTVVEGSSNHLTQNHGYVSAVGDGTFTLGSGATNQNYTNKNGEDFVAWLWNAGSSVSASSSYNITPSSQYVNATAGFSITSYTGNGSDDQTLPHGLNDVPDFVIIKNRDSATGSWQVKHSKLASGKVLFLDTTAQEGDSGYGEIKDLDSNVTVTLDDTGNDAANVNKNTEKYIMYAWTAIPGYSSFGKYTGDSVIDPFIYTGFQPKYVMIKVISTTDSWLIFDNERKKTNPIDSFLQANNTEVQANSNNNQIDTFANGFRINNNQNGTAGDGLNYIYCAFAEHPFKTSRAR